MLRVRVTVSTEGTLTAVEADGHAGYSLRGGDVVCAAATVLLRTAARAYESAPNFSVSGKPEGRGRLEFSVSPGTQADLDWSRGVTEMFVRGIRDLSREFPENVELTVIEE